MIRVNSDNRRKNNARQSANFFPQDIRHIVSKDQPSSPGLADRFSLVPIEMAGPWVTAHEEVFVLDALRNWYGPKAYYYCELFESEFARWHDRKYALMTPSCTAAIHLLMAGLGIGPGDEVIVPDCTWIASAAPITWLNATPVFADIDEAHWCLSAETIAARITPRTKAVVVVDVYGNLPDWDAIEALCAKHGITVIEDSAEALGSHSRGRKAGKFGTGSTFSFHRTKTLTTGEGGMLLVDDDALFERCKLLRDHGRKPGDYRSLVIGLKYMPNNVQAALGYAQFQRVDELVGKKRWILETYRRLLGDIPDLHLNPEPLDGANGVWCSTLVFGRSHGITRDHAMAELRRQNLPTRPFFYPLSSLPAFVGIGVHAPTPIAYDVSARAINLPSALNISEEQITIFCDALRVVIATTSRNRA